MSTLPPSPSAAPGITSLEAFDELIAALADLQTVAEHVLQERRERLIQELASVEAELAEFGDGQRAEAPKTERKTRATAPAGNAREITLAELIAELEAAPERTLNIRKANLDGKHIKALAKANPDLLQLGGKGAWPTVTLAKSSDEATPQARGTKSPQGTFSFGETTPVPRGQKKKQDSKAEEGRGGRAGQKSAGL